MASNNTRVIQYDVMRVVAALAVVWLHTSAQRFAICYPSVEWEARNIYDSLVRWAVPIFVMISGALYLDPHRRIDIKHLYAKSITRIVLIFIFWSIVYCSVYVGVGKLNLTGMVAKIAQGPFHFWFLKMLIGLYIIVPILRVVVIKKKLELYFICLSLVTSFLIPTLFHLLGYLNDAVRDSVERYYDVFGIKIAIGYVSYFVLGHYLANYNVTKVVKKVFYILGILSVLSVIILTHFASIYVGTPYTAFYSNFNILTLFEAIAIFILIRDIQIIPKYHASLISISKLSLGIYILHPLVMEILFHFGNIDSASLNPVYFIPLYAFMVFIISYCISLILTKIPIIKKVVM